MSSNIERRMESPLEQQRKATIKETLATNLTVLRRMDPCIAEIIEMACHAVLYKFLMETQSWEKKDMEGSLFVVKRTVEPLHRLFLLNRSGIENFSLDITRDLLLQIEGPYLMWKSGASEDILGLWIYKEEEHSMISKLVIEIVERLSSLPPEITPRQEAVAASSPRSEIMGMIGATAPHRDGRSRTDSQPLREEDASRNLKGLLGLNITSASKVAPGWSAGGPPNQVSGASSADAGAQILGLLGVVKDGRPAAACSVGTAAPPPHPVPPTQPPSPGAAILAMLKRDFPAPAVAGSLSSPIKLGPHGAVAAGGALLTPHHIASSSTTAHSANEAGITRELLAASVATTVPRVRGPPMSLHQFQQALKSAVEDDTFVAELYRHYLSPPPSASPQVLK